MRKNKENNSFIISYHSFAEILKIITSWNMRLTIRFKVLRKIKNVHIPKKEQQLVSFEFILRAIYQTNWPFLAFLKLD
jgi:hypothetical protein